MKKICEYFHYFLFFPFFFLFSFLVSPIQRREGEELDLLFYTRHVNKYKIFRQTPLFILCKFFAFNYNSIDLCSFAYNHASLWPTYTHTTRK